MRWTPSGKSRNIEDRRSQRPTGRRAAPFGLGGIILILVISYIFKINPMSLLQQTGGGGSLGMETSAPVEPYQSTPQEEQLVQFVSFVLDDTQAVWTRVLPRYGVDYREAKLVLFRDAVQSACGFASAASGPFYCPGDENVYIDLGFYQELRDRFGAAGDVEEGLNAAAVIGYDRMQKMSGQYVNPDAYTHGSSAQRVEWFRRGLDQGDVGACDTFAAASR